VDFKITIYSALIVSAVFSCFSLVFYFGEWDRFAVVTIFGLFIGIIAAPKIEPKKFKHGMLLQISAGVVAGIFAGVFFNLSIDLVASCGVIGGFLGGLAPSWIKHVQIP
jgi:uncharacterized membrane protein YeaQ/YmgE (transglycosylase-associated protein family)